MNDDRPAQTRPARRPRARRCPRRNATVVTASTRFFAACASAQAPSNGPSDHHDRVGDRQRRRPRERRPRRVARDHRDEVRVEDRREHDRRVARVGEVVHRPRRRPRASHAGVEGGHRGSFAFFSDFVALSRLVSAFAARSTSCASSSARSRLTLQVRERERHGAIGDHSFALDALVVAEHEAHLAVGELAAAGHARVAEEAEQAAAAWLRPRPSRGRSPASRPRRARCRCALPVHQDHHGPVVRVRSPSSVALQLDDLDRAEEHRDGLAGARERAARSRCAS